MDAGLVKVASGRCSLLTWIGADMIRHGQDGHATRRGTGFPPVIVMAWMAMPPPLDTLSSGAGAGRCRDRRCEKSTQEQNNSRKGAKPQRAAKQTKQLSFALLCVLAPLRETVYFFVTFKAGMLLKTHESQTKRTKLLVGEDRGVEDEQDHDQTDGQGREAETPPERNDDRGRSGYQMLFQFTLFHKLPVFARPVELELLQRLPLGKHHRVDGKSLRPEVRVEEMHGEDESHGQQRFVTVDDGGHIDQRSG